MYTFYYVSKRFKKIQVKNMSTTVTTRIDESLLHEVDQLSLQKQMDRATFLRNIIKHGVQEEKRKNALEKYKRREYSLQKCASLLNISVLEMIDLLERESLFLDYTKDELREDLQGLL
ncbi:UPF0175 family protein [Candidatus Woesearchaeota archaeon]|nr:UPF0175 family protein [Candidatus Woesearchaeota archaeon]